MPGTEQQIRDIFSRTDPARRATVPPPRITAALLIAHAEAVTTDTRRAALPKAGPARRRLLLTAAATAAVGLAASVLGPLSTDHRHSARQAGPAGAAPAGSVVVPMAFQTDADPPPAADRLRALAANITNAPYDTQTGRYAHRRLKSWSDTQLSHDKLTVGYVEEYDEWTAPDGSGRSHRRIVGTRSIGHGVLLGHKTRTGRVVYGVRKRRVRYLAVVTRRQSAHRRTLIRALRRLGLR